LTLSILNICAKEKYTMDHELLVTVLFYLVPFCAVCALVFAFIQYKKVMRFPEGTPKMIEISAAVRKGARAYLKRQYTGVALFFGAMFIVLGTMAILGFLTPFVPFCSAPQMLDMDQAATKE
jgi:Na+/H+-translocating membrane pyrophosphatase